MKEFLIQFSALIAALIIGFIYYKILAKSSRSNRCFFNWLIACASFIFLGHTLADIYVIKQITIGDANWPAIIALGIFHSIELFLFQTHFFDNGYQEFFFGVGRTHMNGSQTIESLGHPWLVYVFVIAYVLAVITSIAWVIKIFNRKRAGRGWLASHKKEPENAHIFFHGGKIAFTLAEDIKKNHPNQNRIFIGFPDPEENYLDLSIWEKILRLLKSRSEIDLGPFSTIAYSSIPLNEAVGKGICQQMNLKDLDVFLKTSSCKVYLLSDDEEENLRCAEILYRDGCTAEIFCRACREGLNSMYEDAMTKTPSMNVHLTDSSYLAVRNIKNCPELLPVNYVEKGVDKKGRREGWVSSAFNAMILGFGETGREALGFIYEYGAFVDENFKKSPFSCLVMDKMMDKIEYTYRKNYPGMNETNGISYKSCEVGSNEFWDIVSDHLPGLNYIVICLGNDRLNLKTAIEIVEYAFRYGKDLSRDFLILIAQENPSHLDEATLKHYNCIGQYHNCIRTFGNQCDVWTYDNITNESLQARAKHYYAGYMRAKGDTNDPEENWNKRETEIKSTPDFALHAKRVRQRSQDYANCFHISTKLALVGPEIYDCRRDIAKCIPPDYNTNPTHYTGTDEHEEKVLHYLAVHEHIRWEASHVALGYSPGKRTDEVKKTHECIMSYDDLSPEIQHFDYLVVKTTFEWE